MSLRHRANSGTDSLAQLFQLCGQDERQRSQSSPRQEIDMCHVQGERGKRETVTERGGEIWGQRQFRKLFRDLSVFEFGEKRRIRVIGLQQCSKYGPRRIVLSRLSKCSRDGTDEGQSFKDGETSSFSLFTQTCPSLSNRTCRAYFP